MEIWDIPAGVHMVQKFAPYMRHFILQFVGDPKIYKNSTQTPWNKWKISWKIDLDVVRKQALRAMPLKNTCFGIQSRASSGSL